MRPYSCDLRQKIVELYNNGEGSIRQLADRFVVSPDCVRRLLKQERETHSIAPKAYVGGPKPTLQQQHLQVLEQLLQADNDATLVELASRLQQQTQLQVSPSTISRALKKLGITRKKKSQGG
ncbi:MAG: transposase [Leptolyngbyaceae cyanobacterium SM1_4_3]|nr:transposase [Leptolyngbyaceae cyanobacterium SM1_4_3]